MVKHSKNSCLHFYTSCLWHADFDRSIVLSPHPQSITSCECSILKKCSAYGILDSEVSLTTAIKSFSVSLLKVVFKELHKETLGQKSMCQPWSFCCNGNNSNNAQQNR